MVGWCPGRNINVEVHDRTKKLILWGREQVTGTMPKSKRPRITDSTRGHATMNQADTEKHALLITWAFLKPIMLTQLTSVSVY